MTSATQIGISWSEGTSNGGAEVIDFTILYDQSTGTWVELASGVTETEYTTSVTLTQGQTYTFKVKARNSVGFGQYSAEVSILAAQVPD